MAAALLAAAALTLVACVPSPTAGPNRPVGAPNPGPGASASPAPVGYLSLDASELQLPICDGDRRIGVAMLNDEPTCRLEGRVTLVFPDGVKLDADFGGAGSRVGSDSDVRWAWASVGDYGSVAAMFTSGCRHYVEWGRPDAFAKLERAFGPDHAWACASSG